MLNKNCTEFIDALASNQPVPGGGGASAYVAALGVALGAMVGNLTTGKKKYAEFQDDITRILGEAEALIEDFKKLVNEDAEGFKPLAAAYKLPAGTDEEKLLKENAIQKALIPAADVPLEIARKCVEAIKMHEELAVKGTRIALSDVGCGVAFCKAALEGARLSALININMMKDAETKAGYRDELDALTSQAVEMSDKIYKYVEDNI